MPSAKAKGPRGSGKATRTAKARAEDARSDAPPAIEAAAVRPSLPPADAKVLDRARAAPLTRDGIAELAKVALDQLEASLIASIDARDVKAATALALAILAAGGDLAPSCVARLVPDVDQRDLVPSLLRGMRAASDAERLEVMRQAIERGQLSHDREAIVAFVATRLLGDAPWPSPWPGLLRTLARQRLGTEAGVLLGIAIARSGDEAAKAIGAEWIELADKANADEVEQFWIDGWTKPVLEILPETEPPRVVVGYTVRKAQERPGRNDPCHCGSGKKYKKCHASSDEASDRHAESPLVDAARVTATDVEGMRIQEILALEWPRLSRPALVRAVEQLRAYHRWEDAEAALEILAAQGDASDVEELREHLIEEALRMRALDVLDRQLAKLKDRESQKERVKAGIACARPSVDTLRVLDEQARRGLEGDIDATADVAYALLDHAPALGILVARGALDPARTLESDTILEEIEYARDRLGLAPFDAYGPLYDQWVEGREAEQAEATAIAAELARLKAELGRAEGEVEARQAQVVAMEHEIRDMRERLERQAVRDTAAGMPQSEALAAYRVAEEHRQRLGRKVDELKALLAEGNAERAELREKVAALEAQRAERASESAEMAALGPEDEGEAPAGLDEETMPVRVPVFTKKSLLALADMPPKVQRAAVSSAGRLGAGERAAWRDVKRMQGMDAVWTARIGIHHRLIFTIGDSELTVMDVVTREALLTSLERYR